MTSALLRAFSIWMPYKGTYPQWFAVPEWRRLQLLPLGQNKGDWRHLQTCIPFIVSPKEGWLSQLPKKDERGKKSGTRKKSFFFLYIAYFLPTRLPCQVWLVLTWGPWAVAPTSSIHLSYRCVTLAGDSQQPLNLHCSNAAASQRGGFLHELGLHLSELRLCPEPQQHILLLFSRA